jgi:hypothetical protein
MHRRTCTPDHEGFSACAFARSVSLPGTRYVFGAPWRDYTGGIFTRYNVNWHHCTIRQVLDLAVPSSRGFGDAQTRSEFES